MLYSKDMQPNDNIPEKLLKPYDPSSTEDRIYKLWEDSGLFNPDTCVEKGVTNTNSETFSMVMPPPNVTGVLHMGHALMISWQDIAVRYNRMQGRRTLWLPGTDHAAIATQSKVEKDIQKKESLSRHDLGREELLKRIEKFANESHDTIVGQVKKLGASCDWSREAFTLDEERNLAVNTIFKQMYEDGIIYRGYRLVNWDPKGQTTISDDEIVYEERKAKLYTFKYSKDFPISIATTRPETKVGDTAVAVNPDDTRYQKYIGQTFHIPNFCGVSLNIKIIADKNVDKDFGTGALGVTPAHSMTDYEMAKENSLPIIPVIDEYAKMIVGGENIKGKKVAEAREVIVEWLKGEGLMENEVEIDQRVSTAERTNGIIEPLPKLQWFVDVNKEFILKHSEIKGIESGSKTTLKEIMKKGVESAQIEIIPEHFNKTYFHWIENLRDWCISRQIWYGHRIPVWYRGDEIYCGIIAPDEDGWAQDPDTLDTWFSSGLWTFSTLGWPNKTKDLETYHPTTLIQPGTEILFFWVARMILMTGYALGTIPFKTVLLNGIVRDSQGRKMSKSLGNGGDPIEYAGKYGADAIRMYFAIATTAGTDSRLYEEKIKGYKHFANKLWNIARFVLSAPKADTNTIFIDKDQKILDEFNETKKEITQHLDEYTFHLAGEKLYHYIWNTFADIIIEESKEIFKNGNEDEKNSRSKLLYTLLEECIKTLHPFMPYVTEELWGHALDKKTLLIGEKW
jgi:valyl-tRNA synthetase